MRAILFLIALILTSACTPRPKPPAPSARGTAVAKVGDTVITDTELADRIAAIEKTFPRTYSTHVQKKQLLEEMMHIELLYQKAIDLKLDQKYEFKSRLADLYIHQLSEQARAGITEKELQQEFESHKDQYQQVSARHILIRADSKKPDEKKASLKKIQEIRAEAVKSPEKFQDLAKANSQDGSASGGGELGFFTRAMMVAPFSKAAFELKNVNDISPVVETQFGYHIIQLSGDRRAFDFHKDLIRDRLLRTTQRERLDAEIARLAKDKKTEIYEDNLAKMSPLPNAVTTEPEKLVPLDEPEKKSP